MNTLFLTLKDKVLGYKQVYEQALVDSSELMDMVLLVSELDTSSDDSNNIVLNQDQINTFTDMFNKVKGMTLSFPGSNSIIQLDVVDNAREIALRSANSDVIRILKSSSVLQFGRDFYTLGAQTTMRWDEFIQGITGQFLISELMTKLSSYAINPNATIDGACSLVRSAMNGNASLMETCDSLEQYFLNSPDTCTAFLSFVTEQNKVLKGLKADNNNGTISFDSDYVISNTFSVPFHVVGQVASAVLSGILAIFSPVIGIITYATSRVVGKVVDYVKSNLSTVSVAYTSEYDTPTYAQPLLQYKQKLTDNSPVDISSLLSDLSLELNQEWVIKVYWYGVCIFIWSDPRNGFFCIESYLIPLWYPVREGGGNIAYEGTDTTHTLNGFWSTLTALHLPIKFGVDNNNLPQFRLVRTTITDSELQDLWSLGEISPSDFSLLSESERLDAVKQSMFWWGLLAIPSTFIGSSDETASDWVSYNPKLLYNSPDSYKSQLWKMAFAISLSSMIDYDYQESSLNPLFNINRDWNILTTFKQVQEYFITFKQFFSDIMSANRNVYQSNTCLITSVSQYGILTYMRNTIFKTSESGCKGIHLLYPPEYTHNVWLQAIVMLVTVAAVATTAIVTKKFVVKKIRKAVLKRKLKLQAQQQQLLNSFSAGTYNEEDILKYMKTKTKADKWNKMLNLGKYDITSNTSDIDDRSSLLEAFGDKSKTQNTIGKIYRAITGQELTQ